MSVKIVKFFDSVGDSVGTEAQVETLYYCTFYGDISAIELICKNGHWSWADVMGHGGHGSYEGGFISREEAVSNFLGRFADVGGPPKLHDTAREATAEYRQCGGTPEGVATLRREAKSRLAE